MPSLNDIDNKLLEKRFLIETLVLLGKEDHRNLYCFYLKYLENSIKSIKLESNNLIIENLEKIFKILFYVKLIFI